MEKTSHTPPASSVLLLFVYALAAAADDGGGVLGMGKGEQNGKEFRLAGP